MNADTERSAVFSVSQRLGDMLFVLSCFKFEGSQGLTRFVTTKLRNSQVDNELHYRRKHGDKSPAKSQKSRISATISWVSDHLDAKQSANATGHVFKMKKTPTENMKFWDIHMLSRTTVCDKP